MQWDALAVFAAVAETESFTRAAARLDLPKSTVSRQITALEAELGTRLLHRTTRRVALTPAGRRLLERVGPHVAALGRVGRGDLDDDVSGTLRVTCSPDLGSAVLADVVARYAILHPEVRVDVRLTLDVVDLVAEGLDLAVRATSRGLPDSPHLTAARVGTIQLAVFASPRYLARAGTPRTVEELAGHDVVGFLGRPPFEGFPEARLACDDAAFARAVVRAGGGIGVLPSFFVEDDLAAGELIRLLPEWKAWTASVWVVTPHGPRPPRRVGAFRELLVETLQRTGVLGGSA